MVLECSFTFPLVRGLHARPAAALRERAQLFRADCLLLNERNGRSSDLRDLLSLIATNTGYGDLCRLTVQGPDAPSAMEALSVFLTGEFLETDGEPTPPHSGGIGTIIPQLLMKASARWWVGQGVSPGLGEGLAVMSSGFTLPAEEPRIRVASAEMEIKAFTAAMAQVEGELAAESIHAEHPTLRAILEAHRAMLQDRAWRGSVALGIRDRNLSARSAILEAGQAWAKTLESSDHVLLRERAADVRGLSARLVRALGGSAPEAPLQTPAEPFVLVARDLPLNLFPKLDRTHLRGLLLTDCGPTSHIAILARTFGIPLVVGIHGLPSTLPPGTRLLVDGLHGAVVEDAPATVSQYFAVEAEAQKTHQERLKQDVHRAPDPGHGQPLSVQANLALAEEGPGAFALGADGVGLFRTEMLFLERAAPPTEDEQVEIYHSVLAAAGNLPVTLRLLDAGGDKPLPFLRLPFEANPFLGQRAVRWYAQHPEIIRTQVRAAIRAAADGGNLRIMIPMVTEPAELAWVRNLVQEEAQRLGRPVPPLGAMVEVPAAALHLAALADQADFFCVGSNDLVQYLFAADRNLPSVARPEFAWHPVTLRLLESIVRSARTAGRPLSLCGEMAARPELLPLLVGLGFDTVSVAPSAILELKRAARSLDAASCKAMAHQAMACSSAEEVEALFRPPLIKQPTYPVVEAELLELDTPCLTKEEAIKRLVERVFLAGRTEAPAMLEEAIWARERVFATGVGHGFAVPHCQTKAMACATLAMLRLAEPVDWGASDDPPVRTVLLLALPGEDVGEEHLRLFARLARRLMDEAFRRHLEETPDPQALLETLRTEVLSIW
ncbi:phosphoenolpyruvate--protein phosphotransferase [Geothrix sp. PMB-07]|uniref:phosphoenolpyruvate--protein phosphotransferase n=1 Tax=Geothrix sp. PMB-07 TaxID=3068640 RepID=UPI0027407AB8|nr:phosphoenolpyruvate--protein phosphotransferase [Geothrix sp. PMB-07]WLT30431.1 phosphoenolpyruvate--protein phosphotransferase [Geothrix sp. PMB-07]